MAAGKYNMLVEQGATFSRAFTVSGWNLTGYTIRMQVRPTATDSATPILEATTGTDGRIVLTNPTSGIFTLTLSAATTAALTAGNYVYDLELVSGSSVVTRLLEGDFIVVANVTR